MKFQNQCTAAIKVAHLDKGLMVGCKYSGMTTAAYILDWDERVLRISNSMQDVSAEKRFLLQNIILLD